jgi:hypothetical protein
MRTAISRWFLFGLLIGWSVTHASVFGQTTGAGQSSSSTTQPASSGPARTSSTSIDKIKQGLDKAITVDFTGQSIEDILNHVRDRSGVPISIDDQSLGMGGMNFLRPDGQPMQFQIKATNEKTSTVLRKFLNTYRLSYVIFENSVLVTTDEMAVMRQMRQRVSVNLEDVPANKAIRDLAKNHGINLVIDPKVATQADARVSLQVDNTGIETAVRLLAELASLKAVRMGNVMFVTSEEKAKKIRDEEQHQFDNPLNPNLPGGGGPPAIGFGGAFGGLVMPRGGPPAIAVPANPGLPPVPAIDPVLPKAPPAEPEPARRNNVLPPGPPQSTIGRPSTGDAVPAPTPVAPVKK